VFSVPERMGSLIAVLSLFALGALWILEAQRMPPGEFSVPGPGFFPTLLAACLCLATAGLGIQAWRGRTAEPPVQVGHRYIWATLGAILALAFIFERVGFICSMTLFVGFLLRVLSPLRWSLLIPAAIAAAGAAYFFFGTMLGLRLPPTPWS
jgi:putative tricarboxylic transport membrane protein